MVAAPGVRGVFRARCDLQAGDDHTGCWTSRPAKAGWRAWRPGARGPSTGPCRWSLATTTRLDPLTRLYVASRVRGVPATGPVRPPEAAVPSRTCAQVTT